MVDGSDRRHGRDLGHSIIGYGSTRHDRSSGCGADWFPIGLSPRKTSLVLYSTTEQDPMLLAALGKHKRGVGYLYIAKLDDIDRHALRALINDTVIAPTADPHSLLSSTTQRPAQEPAMCSGVGARDDRTLHGH